MVDFALIHEGTVDLALCVPGTGQPRQIPSRLLAKALGGSKCVDDNRVQAAPLGEGSPTERVIQLAGD